MKSVALPNQKLAYQNIICVDMCKTSYLKLPSRYFQVYPSTLSQEIHISDTFINDSTQLLYCMLILKDADERKKSQYTKELFILS